MPEVVDSKEGLDALEQLGLEKGIIAGEKIYHHL